MANYECPLLFSPPQKLNAEFICLISLGSKVLKQSTHTHINESHIRLHVNVRKQLNILATQNKLLLHESLHIYTVNYRLHQFLHRSVTMKNGLSNNKQKQRSILDTGFVIIRLRIGHTKAFCRVESQEQ